jgi:hypothetical protein
LFFRESLTHRRRPHKLLPLPQSSTTQHAPDTSLASCAARPPITVATNRREEKRTDVAPRAFRHRRATWRAQPRWRSVRAAGRRAQRGGDGKARVRRGETIRTQRNGSASWRVWAPNSTRRIAERAAAQHGSLAGSCEAAPLSRCGESEQPTVVIAAPPSALPLSCAGRGTPSWVPSPLWRSRRRPWGP